MEKDINGNITFKNVEELNRYISGDSSPLRAKSDKSRVALMPRAFKKPSVLTTSAVNYYDFMTLDAEQEIFFENCIYINSAEIALHSDGGNSGASPRFAFGNKIGARLAATAEADSNPKLIDRNSALREIMHHGFTVKSPVEE